MDSNIINKISSIIVTEEQKSELKISLLDIIVLINNIYKEISEFKKNIIKKINMKLSNNLAFFNYEIKEIEVLDTINIYINHELKTKKIVLSKTDFEVQNEFKNQENFKEIIIPYLKDLLSFLSNYDYLEKLKVKTKDRDVNINIGPQFVEVFMYKSPNWITMGKAFSLKYDFNLKKFKYENDFINLEKSIKNQEKFLFSKICIKKEELPNDFQLKHEYYKNNDYEEKESKWHKFKEKISRIFKK